MHPVEQYLRSMGEIRRTGAAVPETSYYGAFETLLNEVGDDLAPRVRAVLEVKSPCEPVAAMRHPCIARSEGAS